MNFKVKKLGNDVYLVSNKPHTLLHITETGDKIWKSKFQVAFGITADHHTGMQALFWLEKSMKAKVVKIFAGTNFRALPDFARNRAKIITEILKKTSKSLGYVILRFFCFVFAVKLEI